MTTTQTAAPTTAKLRPGQIVRYNGSQRACEGWLFRVNSRYDLDGGAVRYDLSEWQYGQKFDENDRTCLHNVRPGSVTHVPAVDILDGKCPECEWEYWYLRGDGDSCPACRLTAEAVREACG